jgi:hypothetical protein
MSKQAKNLSLETEYLPVETFFRTLSDQTEVRIIKILHPITGQPVTIMPYLDLAKALSYDKESIRQMIYRTPWVKKHSVTCIIQAADGKYYPTLCLFEEGVVGIFMKLDPSRCKDKEIANNIDQRQEELVYLLKSALTGKQALTVDEYKKIRLSMDLVGKIEKTKDPDLREVLYQQLERNENRPIKRLGQLSLGLDKGVAK